MGDISWMSPRCSEDSNINMLWTTGVVMFML